MSLAAVIFALGAFVASSDEPFGFGDDASSVGFGSEGETATAEKSWVKVGGELKFGTTSFFSSSGDAVDTALSGQAEGRLNFEAKGSSVDAALKLKLSKAILSESPESIVDEAFVRIYLGPLDLEGGLLKVSWGKADSEGPLDVLNPFDYTDMTVTDTRERKIAEPMLHGSIALGNASKLELAFLPGFEGNKIDWDGDWTPKAISDAKDAAYQLLYAKYYDSYSASLWASAYAAAYEQAIALGSDAIAASSKASLAANTAVANSASLLASQARDSANDSLANLLDYPDTETLEYAQGGIRFTTTIGPADVGFQYFYGYLPDPALSFDVTALAASSATTIPVSYSRYHQAGADFATVVAGFNVRAEFAADLTEDLDGEDPDIHNPFLAWSLGFDRDLFSGVNLNLLGTGSFRLLEDGIGTESGDIESDTDRTSTKIIATLKQSLFKDTLEWKVITVIGVEDRDYLLRPSLEFSIGDANVDVAAGFFGGDEDGELGQFDDNDYLQVSLSYMF